MAKTLKVHGSPGVTEDSEQNLMVGLARAQAKKQLMEGTASAQVVLFYLDLGSPAGQLRKEKLERENELLTAKTKALGDAKEVQKLYIEALTAMRTYSGAGDESSTSE